MLNGFFPVVNLPYGLLEISNEGHPFVYLEQILTLQPSTFQLKAVDPLARVQV
jgi:hypothetical protein